VKERGGERKRRERERELSSAKQSGKKNKAIFMFRVFCSLKIAKRIIFPTLSQICLLFFRLGI